MTFGDCHQSQQAGKMRAWVAPSTMTTFRSTLRRLANFAIAIERANVPGVKGVGVGSLIDAPPPRRLRSQP
jgi:hypothetical protein